MRIRNLCGEYDTTYVYDTNVKLSRLLQKTTNGITTKYVYGLGLIGQEKEYCFRTYHFDYRGSTVAITDMYGNVIDRFEYDTYGKVISHTGNSFVIFGFNGRDGVVTDKNGLLYMRARYYSPDMQRFINADVIHGKISRSVTLNRYAYANGNPVSNIDPFGLSAERGGETGNDSWWDGLQDWFSNAADTVSNWWDDTTDTMSGWWGAVQDWFLNAFYAVKDWFIDAGTWLNENALNKDGSYSLYDNQRFRDSVFHEQLLVFTPSAPSLDLREGNIGLGSLSADGITGGWEGEHANLSLLDFGHAEVSAEFKNGHFSLGALASIWSPSFSVTFCGITIEIGAEVGAVGAEVEVGTKGFSLKGAYTFGASISVSW